MNIQDKYKTLITVSTDILIRNTPDGVCLRNYFTPPLVEKLSDVVDIMFSSLQDYQRMPNTIKYNDNKSIFKKILFEFDVNKILQEYSDYEDILDIFIITFKLNINRNDNHNLWVKYAKSIYSACNFMKHFSNLKDFREFVDKFRTDELVTLALVLLLEHEIFGMGFALACNFLKDIGYTDFGKPDVHIKDVLCGLGFCSENDFEILNTMKEIGKVINITAFEVDRLLWLVCSGNYFIEGIRSKPAKQQLIEEMKHYLSIN